jgi:peptide alpha-N-acetyltransferase
MKVQKFQIQNILFFERNEFYLFFLELEEPPSTILWTMIFLAQHFDREKNYVRALELIDEAIEHTPLAIDAYMYRAKILKHAGDIQQAARQMDNCRQLDLADRYLNTITTRYLLLADCATQADSTVELFTRDADNHNVSLTEMQCVWYEQNAANHFLRTKQFGKSLKKALAIDTVKNQKNFFNLIFMNFLLIFICYF